MVETCEHVVMRSNHIMTDFEYLYGLLKRSFCSLMLTVVHVWLYLEVVLV